jgi:cytochrome c-type biogenesis protein CcmH/NrfF
LVQGDETGPGGVAAAAVTLGLALAGLLACSPATDNGSEQKVRAERIQGALLAPCCYTEPVSRHQSEVAVKMRVEIARWVAEGRTDREILDAYVRQYGSKVLVDPRTIPGWWTPWVPWLMVVFGVVFGFWILRRWRNNPLAAALPASSGGQKLPDFDDEE